MQNSHEHSYAVSSKNINTKAHKVMFNNMVMNATKNSWQLKPRWETADGIVSASEDII